MQDLPASHLQTHKSLNNRLSLNPDVAQAL